MKSKSTILLIATLALAGASTLPAVTNTVIVGSFFFNPNTITINSGDYIRWSNTSLTIHDTTRTNVSNPWFSPDMAAGSGSYLLRFTNAGTFPYFCQRHVYAANPANRHPEQTGSVSVVAANLPPSVSLTNPVPDAKFRAPTDVVLQATAADDGAVTNVQFFSNGNSLGNDSSAPYSLTLNNAAAGNYSFTARAQDNGGLSATSAVINVFVLTNAILTDPTVLPNGQFKLTIQGISNQTYTTERSTNLTSWSAIATNLAPANSFNITDSTSTNVLQNFYRTRQDY